MEALVIPLKLDSDAALAELRKLAHEGGEAGKKVEEGARGATKSIGLMESGVDNIVRSFAAMAGATAGMAAISNIAQTLAAGLAESAKNLGEMAKQFTDFRRLNAELAGIQGKGPNDSFTLEQAQLAEQAKVDPVKFTMYQQAMVEQIAGNIGPGKTLSQDQANRVTQQTAAFGVARGLSPEAISMLVGGLTRQAQAGPDADKQILDRFGKLINLMDSAPGKVEKLLPELNEVMATGTSAEDAGTMVSVMAGRGRPGEAGTYGVAMQRAIRKLYTDGKAGGLGLTEDMSDVQAARQLYGAAGQSGVDMNNPRAVAMWLSQQGITETEGISALQTMFGLGFRQQGVENAFGAIQAGGVGAMDESISRFRGSDEGRMQQAEARTQLARLRQGARLSEWLTAQEDARGDLTDQGMFTRYSGEGMWRDAANTVYRGALGDSARQMTDERALERLRGRARLSGVAEEDIAPVMGLQTAAGAQNQALAILQAIEKNTNRGNEVRPLTAAPPNPQTRP